MSDARRKRGWGFWTAVAVTGLSLLYLAAFGPACWLVDRQAIHPILVARVYTPLLKIELCRHGIEGYPRWLGALGIAVYWYGNVGANQNNDVIPLLHQWADLSSRFAYATVKETIQVIPVRRAAP